MQADAPHILTVNPWIHDFAAYDVWAKPMGLLILAALLRSHGYRVTHLDCLDRFHPNAPVQDPGRRNGRGPYLKTSLPAPPALADVPRRFSRYGIAPEWFRADLAAVAEPDLVLVTSFMTYWATGVAETIAAIRHVHPRTPVILGGIYATLCREHARRHAGADLVVAGPAETRILELAAQYTGLKDPLPQIPVHPDRWPWPAFDLQRKIPYVPLLTSRGCPFSCDYCASHLLQPKPMRRSPDSVVEEIRFWHGVHGVAEFALYDDAFLVDAPHHAVPILEKVVASGMRLRFHTPNALHIREISAKTARLMAAAGFETLRLGLETAEPDDHGRLDRKTDTADFLRAVERLQQAGFHGNQIGVYLLVGLPNQKPEAVDRAIDLVKRAGATPIPAYYTPIPGTALWERAKAASRYDLAADPIFTNNAILPCQKSPFSWETVARIRQRVAQPKEIRQ